jgi:hypothetical protein
MCLEQDIIHNIDCLGSIALSRECNIDSLGRMMGATKYYLLVEDLELSVIGIETHEKDIIVCSKCSEGLTVRDKTMSLSPDSLLLEMVIKRSLR